MKEYLDYLNDTNRFKSTNVVEHINNFSNHFLGEICKVVKMPGQDFSKELKCDVLKKATKDQVSSWMEVLIFALTSHTVPLLQSGCTACGTAKSGEN